MDGRICRLGKKGPGDQTAQYINRVTRDLVEELREDQCKNDHHAERLDHGPGDTEKGSFITRHDIAPDELKDKIAVLKNSAQLLQRNRAAFGAVVDGGSSGWV